MFSGIIEELGRVQQVGAESIAVSAPVVLADTRVSDSIAVNGVCLTVARIAGPLPADQTPL